MNTETNGYINEPCEEMEEYVFKSKEDLKDFLMENLKEDTIVVLRVEKEGEDGERADEA